MEGVLPMDNERGQADRSPAWLSVDRPLVEQTFRRYRAQGDDVLVEDPLGHLFRVADSVAAERSQGQKSERELLLERAREAYLRRAVEHLPQVQRECLLAHVNDGLTYDQIAKQRGLARKVVLRSIAGAYAQLRSAMHWIDGDDPPPPTEVHPPPEVRKEEVGSTDPTLMDTELALRRHAR
jgi:Sigma-70, region 4